MARTSSWVIRCLSENILKNIIILSKTLIGSTGIIYHKINNVNTEFIEGLATVEDQMVMLLDIDKMLTTDEIHALEGISEESSAAAS